MTGDAVRRRATHPSAATSSGRTLALAALVFAALLSPAPADTLTPPALAQYQQSILTLTPEQATNDVNEQHTVVAHAEHNGQPAPGQEVQFRVTGANTATGQAQTDQQGNAPFTYQGTNPGSDTITAFVDVDQNGQLDPGEPSDTASKTWQSHVKKDPRTDDWPKLTAEEMKSVQDLIDGGKNGEALAKLVEIMKKYCCNFDTMAGGVPTYDPKLDDEGRTERKKGGKVRIGKDAFRSAAWLYSSLKHEMVHSAQWQDEDAAEKLGSSGREKEAYQREIDQAGNTGISEKDKKDLEERIKEY